MKQFVIGEEVKVKSWSELVEEFGEGQDIESGFYCGEVYFDIEMKPLCGKVILVTEDNLRYNEIELEIKKEVWTITDDMVHFLNDCETETLRVELTIDKPPLKIKKLREDAIIPTYATEGDSGLDLHTLDDCVIKANQTVVIPTGIAIELPYGNEATVRGRSGINLNGLKGCKTASEIVYNNNNTNPYPSPNTHTTNTSSIIPIGSICQPYVDVKLGTIDLGYRSDVGIITKNTELYDILIPKRTKLAQLVVSPVTYVKTELVKELAETERGSKGFGSTGV